MIQRIINNKHYSDSSQITRDKFLSEGEIVISNEYGLEGIYILNTNGDVVRIGKGADESESGSTEVDIEFVKNYLRAQAYMTSADTAEMLSVLESVVSALTSDYTAHKEQNATDIASLDERVTALENATPSQPSSGSGEYDPAALNELNEKISLLSAATEAHEEQNVVDFQDVNERISGLTAQILTEEQVRDIATQEIAFLVSSADTMFDTLRAIAEWITNDETGSAQLIADVVTVKEAVSGLTERVSAVENSVISVVTDVANVEGRVDDVENDVADIAESVIELSGSVVEHIAQNEADLQELNDKVDAIEVPEIPEPVSDEHIRDIAAQEVASLVSSADSMYQVLQELADWVENDSTGSAQLIADVGELKDAVSANTSNLSTAFEQIQGTREILDSHQDDIDTLYERVEAVEDAIENIPSAVTPSSGSSIDEETINALRAYIDAKIAEITRESDHVFLTRAQYSEIVSTGQVTIDGVVYHYSDNVYYCIYEGTAPTPSGETSGSSYEYDEETGMIEFSGATEITDGVVEIAGSVDEDGYVTIEEAEPIPDTPDVDDEGFIEVGEDQVDNDGYINVPDNWEII